MSIEQRILDLKLELPTVAEPVGAYVPAVRVGDVVLTSGQLPLVDGKLVAAGKVPKTVPLDLAQRAAAQALLNALAAVKSVIGSLDRVQRIIRMNVFVNSSVRFTDQAQVANGASELLQEIFGDAGRHTRCAVGVAELPLNAPLELDLTVAVR